MNNLPVHLIVGIYIHFTAGTHVVASIDSRSLLVPIVRHSQCKLLVSKNSLQCISCADYRHTLRTLNSHHVPSLVEQAKRVATSSHTNYICDLICEKGPFRATFVN